MSIENIEEQIGPGVSHFLDVFSLSEFALDTLR